MREARLVDVDFLGFELLMHYSSLELRKLTSSQLQKQWLCIIIVLV